MKRSAADPNAPLKGSPKKITNLAQKLRSDPSKIGSGTSVGGMGLMQKKKIKVANPNMKESDLETLDKIITDKEFEELLEEHGIN